MTTIALAGMVSMLVLFAIVWSICVRVRNYGFLDVTWTFGIGLLALADGLWGSGVPLRRLAYATVGVAWSLRLGTFVLRRVLRHHPQEDKRYATLRERWPGPGAFLAFFELQAVIAVVFSVPFWVASGAPDPHMSVLEWLGLGLAAVGIGGESIADWQAAAFKSRAASTPRILDAGLWRYSRHPNYFFETVVWVGFAVAASALPWGWLASACPVLILYFLLRVTGIPLTEQHSLATHGEAYRAYQRRTSAFVPWAPKSAA